MSSVQNFEKPLFVNCTPLNDKANRYMRWNGHGTIRHFNHEDCNQINVQFHDTSVHSSIEFTNERNYSFADLSSTAVVFASTKLIHCIHFDKQFEENEWSTHMNKGEQIKAICLSDKFIAVATNKRIVRFYSLNGTQYQMISIPGPIQCMTASNETLVAVYHRQLPLPDCQSLDAMIIEVDFESGRICNLDYSPVRLPLNTGSQLKWIGFTDEGTLSLFDSSGNLKLFKNGLGLNWIEVANLYDQVDDNVESIFIVSISDLLEVVRCVLCYKSRYPSPECIPVMQNLKFNLELCKTTNEVNDLEEKNILSNVKCSMLNSLAQHDIDTHEQVKATLKQQVDSLFKIFQDANKQNNEARQLDAASLIPSLKTIESLINYSTQSKLMSLVPKLEDLVQKKRDEADENRELIRPLFSALPNEQSTLHMYLTDDKSSNCGSTNILTPLVIDKSTFEKPKPIIEIENPILDQIALNDFRNENDCEPLQDDKKTIDDDDELFREVASDDIRSDIKNPFKI